MQIFVTIIISLLLLILISIPAWLIWFVGANLLPKRLQLPPVRMTALSVVLSLISAFILRLEFESGSMNGLMVFLLISISWSAMLLTLTTVVKYLVAEK